MCGIAGILGCAGSTPTRRELAGMIGQLAHRGPDGSTLFVDGPIGLAHARLSIIDLAGGTQPIRNEDGSVQVIFNGEIFNYIELRAELQAAGHVFYTRSDTEVIVHLYEQHGDDFVDHLNGQFAIALWDARRQRLVLARDRTGIRPLFYLRAGGRWLFASEVKALFALPEVQRRLDPQALGELFTFWSPLPPRTAYAGISSLPPGHMLVLDAQGAQQLRCFWDWSFPEQARLPRLSFGDSAMALRELLIDAVRLQLRADVPVGAYLSGGLDSSIITSVIRNFTDTPLRTFSMTFEDGEFDESSYQQELVDFLGTHHTALRVTRADIGRVFPQVVWHAESPLLRTAPAPMLLLARRVRAEGYRVVLTGEGADEVFAGYDVFKEAKLRRWLARNPDSTWRPRLLDRLYPYLKHSPSANRVFAQQFFGHGLEEQNKPWFGHLPRWTTTARGWQFFSAEVRHSLAGWQRDVAVRAQLPEAIDRWAPLARAQYVEAHTLMSGYLLSSQGDRMAMAGSIEARFPFLDHRLIEFANALPSHYKLLGLREKRILKEAMADLVPESVRRRTKQPYRAPDCASFFVDGQPLPYVRELLAPTSLKDAGYFDPPAVARLLEKCRAGRAIGFADNMAFVGIVSTMLVDRMLLHGESIDAGTSALAAA